MARLIRPTLFVLGLAALALLIREIGAAQLWRTILGAGLWLPFILLLDLLWLSCEGLALLHLYGHTRRRIPGRVWVEVTLLHFATFMVLPAGRASAEAARAGLTSGYVGRARAVAAAAVMQSLTLGANAMMSVACLGAVTMFLSSAVLVGALSLNIAITLSLGSLLYLILRRFKVGGRLSRLSGKLRELGPEADAAVLESRPRHGAALLICFAARWLQTLQYAVIFFAVAKSVSVPHAMAAHGVQLAARTVGDAIPNQLGVTEAAFATASAALGLGDQLDLAVAIALLARFSNLSVAAGSALVAQLISWTRQHSPVES